MRKFYTHITYLFLIVLLQSGCQNVKDGLSGAKKSNSDEFLIEKKNPLVLPPEFNKLPEPQILSKKEKNNETEINLKSVINKQSTGTEASSTKSNLGKSLEKSILEKIKDN